jgi:hypothetical protein
MGSVMKAWMSGWARRAAWARMGLGTAMAAVPALGACGPGATVRDWGLHLAWVEERDCRHPERPATLVEVPWSAGNSSSVSGRSGAEGTRPLPAPEVRSGMRVRLGRRDAMAEIHLYGTALGTARRGERVVVRAGWDGALLHGTVSGPGAVELDRVKGGE